MSDRYRRSRVVFEPVDDEPLRRHNEDGSLVNLVRGFQDSFSKAFSDLSDASESELPDLIRELGKLENLVEATTTRAGRVISVPSSRCQEPRRALYGPDR